MRSHSRKFAHAQTIHTRRFRPPQYTCIPIKSRTTGSARLDQSYRAVLRSAPVVAMPVGLEQWRAAVGAWNAKIGRPPTPRLCQPWRGWMKRSDPTVYKAYLALIITLLDVVKLISRRVKEKVRVSVGPRCSSALRVVVAVLFVMLVAIFSVVLSLLIIAGDVEQNPGPPTSTCILYELLKYGAPFSI